MGCLIPIAFRFVHTIHSLHIPLPKLQNPSHTSILKMKILAMMLTLVAVFCTVGTHASGDIDDLQEKIDNLSTQLRRARNLKHKNVERDLLKRIHEYRELRLMLLQKMKLQQRNKTKQSGIALKSKQQLGHTDALVEDALARTDSKFDTNVSIRSTATIHTVTSPTTGR